MSKTGSKQYTNYNGKSDVIIEAINLHKTYLLGSNAVPALRGIDLTIKREEFITIMGPSGCGKTTLLNLLGGLDYPTRGKIFLEGRDLSKFSDNELADLRRDRIGYVFQFYNLLPLMTALENVMIPLHFKGVLSPAQKRKRAMQLLSMVGLAERAKHTPSELSGGEQQRVAIARALANNPALVLLDEPTGDLDSNTSREILELIKDLNDRGATFFASTHDKRVPLFAKRNLDILDGRLIKESIIEDGEVVSTREIQHETNLDLDLDEQIKLIKQRVKNRRKRRKIKTASEYNVVGFRKNQPTASMDDAIQMARNEDKGKESEEDIEHVYTEIENITRVYRKISMDKLQKKLEIRTPIPLADIIVQMIKKRIINGYFEDDVFIREMEAEY